LYERNGNIFRDVYGNNDLLIDGRNENSVFNFLVDINSDFSNSFFEKHNNKVVLFNSKEYEHNSTDSFISLNGKDITNFTLQTGNIIGYISNGKYSIKISSRFGDNFLKFIISDADGFLEVPNVGGSSSENSYEWLLVFLWKIKLLKAYRLGIPKKYINQKNKLRVVRGNKKLLNYYTVGKDIGIY
jgi:hypothetical protein